MTGNPLLVSYDETLKSAAGLQGCRHVPDALLIQVEVTNMTSAWLGRLVVWLALGWYARGT